jgi:hypothetical protein
MPPAPRQQALRRVRLPVCLVLLALPITLLWVGAALASTFAFGVGTASGQGDCSHAVAAVQHTVGESIAHHSSFTSLVVSPHDTQNTIAVIDRTDKSHEIVDPLTVRCGGRLLGYIGRLGTSIIVEISANQAQMTERIGSKTIPIGNPLTAGLVSSRHLHPGDVYGNDVGGFVEGSEIFGAALPLPAAVSDDRLHRLR